MQITILSNSKETVPTAKGSYDKLEIAYKDDQGQVKGKKVMSFGDGANAFKALKNATAGQYYEITSEKIGDFWVWTKVELSDGSPSSSIAPTNSSASSAKGKVLGSTYETPEERAKKQVFIIRQSSLTTALTFLNGKAKSVSEVIQIAKEFENFVHEGSLVAVAESQDIV